MKFIYRTRKEKIFIEILKETILVTYENKYGLWLSSVSENQNEFEQDIKDLLELCKTRASRKWVRLVNWDMVTYYRYNMNDVEFVSNLKNN